MASDDDLGENEQPGLRRSSYTPPPEGSEPFSLTDDDALADALAADLDRVMSGPITIITPETEIPAGPAVTQSPAATEPPASWQPPIEQAPPAEQTSPAEQTLPTEQALPAEQTLPTEQAPPAWQAPPAAVPVPEPAPAPPSAWSDLPAPDPAQAVPLPDAPPARTSMGDDELSRWVAEAQQRPGGTLEVIEQLQNHMRLREDEAREFRAWEDRMRSLATPESLGAVGDAQGQFSGILPESPAAPATGSFVQPEVPIAEWPAPDFAAEVPASEPAPPAPAPAPAEPPAVSLPAWDVPAPSATWAPAPDWDDTSVAAPTTPAIAEQEFAAEPVAEPEIEPEPEPEPAPWNPPPLIEPTAETLAQAPAPEPRTRAPFDWSPTGPIASPVVPPPVEPPTVPPAAFPSAAFPAPTFPEASFAASFPAATTAADDDAVVVPTLEPETDSVEVEPEPELTVEALPDDAPPLIDTAPPPLVEPSPFGGPPLFPSQAKSPQLAPIDEDDDDPEPGSPAFDWTTPAPPPPPAPIQHLSFDALLAEEPVRDDPQPVDSAPEALFIEPMPVAAGEGVPTDTGSITVIDQAYDEDLDDDVDETDRIVEGLAGPVSVDTAGIAAVSGLISPPSGPISTVRIPAGEQVLFDDEPEALPVFSVEQSNLEPTPVDVRVGRAARLFWLWFASNSSVLSLGVGAAVFAVGMSLRQSIVAILAGVAISFLPLGLTTLAGKRSGQPTMVVSRATFGLIGNVVPAIVGLLSRVFWGAVLLWLLGSSVVVVLVGGGVNGPLGEGVLLIVSLGAAFVIALLVAFAGYPLFARLQLILSIVSGILIVGLVVLTYSYIDLPQALTAADGPWLLTITGAVLVFSVVGLVWANSGAELARYQRTDSSGASSMLWATFGTTIPTFVLIAYGALLAASDPSIADGFLVSPLDTLARLLPSWYPVPLVAAAALSLLSGVILSIYSGGFALQSIGVNVKRQWSVVIVGVLVAAVTALLGFGVGGGLSSALRDLATTLAVPIAAWAGIFAAETMIRNRRFESQSLVRRGGVYADVRWVNLVGFLVFSAVGYGFTTAAVSWLSWQGYGFGFFGIPLDSDLAGTDLGVLVALALGLLLPIVAGIPAIRKQEAMRV